MLKFTKKGEVSEVTVAIILVLALIFLGLAIVFWKFRDAKALFGL